jgi:hypothetical protein
MVMVYEQDLVKVSWGWTVCGGRISLSESLRRQWLALSCLILTHLHPLTRCKSDSENIDKDIDMPTRLIVIYFPCSTVK